MPTRPLLLLTALLATAMLLAACGGRAGDDSTTGKSTTGTTGTASTTPTQTQSSEAIDPMAGASTKPVVVGATNRDTALLTGVRAARHEGYDRVVFEFRNTLPGYDVRYVRRPVRQDGSGRVVSVKGSSIARIRMENALDADLAKASAPLTYTGPTRLSPGTPEVVELVRTGGFEGVLTWVVGLRGRVGYRVATLTKPPRLVVDFRNQ